MTSIWWNHFVPTLIEPAPHGFSFQRQRNCCTRLCQVQAMTFSPRHYQSYDPICGFLTLSSQCLVFQETSRHSYCGLECRDKHHTHRIPSWALKAKSQRSKFSSGCCCRIRWNIGGVHGQWVGVSQVSDGFDIDLIWFDMIWYDLIWFDIIWSDIKSGGFDLRSNHIKFYQMSGQRAAIGRRFKIW